MTRTRAALIAAGTIVPAPHVEGVKLSRAAADARRHEANIGNPAARALRILNAAVVRGMQAKGR